MIFSNFPMMMKWPERRKSIFSKCANSSPDSMSSLSATSADPRKNERNQGRVRIC